VYFVKDRILLNLFEEFAYLSSVLDPGGDAGF
jgi:hypothetical protein